MSHSIGSALLTERAMDADNTALRAWHYGGQRSSAATRLQILYPAGSQGARSLSGSCLEAVWKLGLWWVRLRTTKLLPMQHPAMHPKQASQRAILWGWPQTQPKLTPGCADS